MERRVTNNVNPLEDPLTDLDDTDTPYVHTEAAILRPEGTVTLIRITPETESVAAVMGDWCMGHRFDGDPFIVWTLMPSGLITLDPPYGVGEPNPFVQKVFHRLTGHGVEMRGVVLLVNEGGDPADSARMDAVVIEHSTAVRSLRNRIPRTDTL